MIRHERSLQFTVDFAKLSNEICRRLNSYVSQQRAQPDESGFVPHMPSSSGGYDGGYDDGAATSSQGNSGGKKRGGAGGGGGAARGTASKRARDEGAVAGARQPGQPIAQETAAEAAAAKWMEMPRVSALWPPALGGDAHGAGSDAEKAKARHAASVIVAQGRVALVLYDDDLSVQWIDPKTNSTDMKSLAPPDDDAAGAAVATAAAADDDGPEPAVSIEACERMIRALRLLDVAEPFNGPFADDDAASAGYADAVASPVDLGLVAERLKTRHYAAPRAFAADVRPRRRRRCRRRHVVSPRRRMS